MLKEVVNPGGANDWLEHIARVWSDGYDMLVLAVTDLTMAEALADELGCGFSVIDDGATSGDAIVCLTSDPTIYVPSEPAEIAV